MTPRRIPIRTCCGCGRKSGKRAMVRIVRQPDGGVAVDPTGRASGRGAYLCEDPACWELGLGRNRLERTLRVTIPPDQRSALLAYAGEQGQDWVGEED
ncbi:MAG: YlxR family protein [Chloroflexi bacterium]|nr:YlxR family protein [Chloroflexota bacterium]